MTQRLQDFHAQCDPDDLENTNRLLPSRRSVWARAVDRYAGDLSDRIHPWRNEDGTTIDDLTGDDFTVRDHRSVVNPYTVMVSLMVVIGIVACRGLYGSGRATSTWLAPAPCGLAGAWHRWLTAVPGLSGGTPLVGVASFRLGVDNWGAGSSGPYPARRNPAAHGDVGTSIVPPGGWPWHDDGAARELLGHASCPHRRPSPRLGDSIGVGVILPTWPCIRGGWSIPRLLTSLSCAVLILAVTRWGRFLGRRPGSVVSPSYQPCSCIVGIPGRGGRRHPHDPTSTSAARQHSCIRAATGHFAVDSSADNRAWAHGDRG